MISEMVKKQKLPYEEGQIMLINGMIGTLLTTPDYKLNLITKDIVDSCKEPGVDKLILVSSSGADFKSKSFYLKLKGEVEKYVTDINLKSVSILRPSLLLGKRNEKRFGEKLAQMIMPKISFLMPSNYKPISAEKVARAMVQISKMNFKGVKIFHYKEINGLSDKLQRGNY